MKKMTPEETRAFLLEDGRTGKLATVLADGSPHVVPVWFLLDGDDLIFTTWHAAQKAANLEREPRVALCVDDERPPFAFVLVQGTVEIDKSAKNLKDWTTRIAGRYMGEDQAQAFGKRNAVPGEWLVRLKPEKIVAQKEIAA